MIGCLLGLFGSSGLLGHRRSTLVARRATLQTVPTRETASTALWTLGICGGWDGGAGAHNAELGVSRCIDANQNSLVTVRSTRELNWVQGLDLNQRPSGYEPDELPGCSTLQQREAQSPRHAADCQRLFVFSDNSRLPAGTAPGVLAGSVSANVITQNHPPSIDRKAAHRPACVSPDT